MFLSYWTISNTLAHMEFTPASSFQQWDRTCQTTGSFFLDVVFLYPL